LKNSLKDAIHAELEEFQNNLPDAQMKEIEKNVEVEKTKYIKQFIAAKDSSSARWWKKLPLEEQIGEFGKDTCEKKTSIYFLKTSKTGGTTFANILMRFGFAREGTNFLMGECENGGMVSFVSIFFYVFQVFLKRLSSIQRRIVFSWQRHSRSSAF
jgi:hypothetical protein